MDKKRIVIFSEFGGGAHLSASKAIVGVLSSEYDTKVINIFSGAFASLDPIRKITFKKYSVVDLYNFVARHFWGVRLINIFCALAYKIMIIRKKKMVQLLTQLIDKEKPDMIISVITFVNLQFLNVAKKFNIPFLVVAIDFDATNYIRGICSPDYKKFKFALPFEDVDIRAKISRARIQKDQVEIVGFPIRPQFFEKKDKDEIRKFYGIPQGKKIVMILMGALGSRATYNYAKSIAKIDLPLHMIICLGHNKGLRKKIEGLSTSSQVSKTVLSFTERLSSLMSISDFLITKPGPTSVAEALYINLPMALDGVSQTLFWEKLNLKFVGKNNIGTVVKNYGDIGDIIKSAVFDEENNFVLREKIRNFEKKDFRENIFRLTKEMLG